MSWLSRLRQSRAARDDARLHVGDPLFDDWDVVRDFTDLKTARAWRQHLAESGMKAVITSDWPLDQFAQGDIALRVPPGTWSDADDLLSKLDDDELE
jgi:hypothetical protein